MEKFDNPASRLIKIFNLAKSLNKDNSALEVWANTFGIDSKSSGKVFYHLFQLNSLVVEIKDKIKKIEDIDANLYLKHLNSIEEAISFTNLNIRWVDLDKRLTGEAIYGLEICSDVLSKHYREKEVGEKELKELKKDIDELNEKILASTSLDEDLKNLILDQLEIIRRAISEYRIRGIAGMKEALSQSIGEVVLNQPLFETKNKKIDEVERFGKVLGFLGRLVEKAQDKAIEIGFDKIVGFLS